METTTVVRDGLAPGQPVTPALRSAMWRALTRFPWWTTLPNSAKAVMRTLLSLAGTDRCAVEDDGSVAYSGIFWKAANETHDRIMDVSRETGFHVGTVRKAISKLESCGVIRRPRRADGRVVQVHGRGVPDCTLVIPAPVVRAALAEDEHRARRRGAQREATPSAEVVRNREEQPITKHTQGGGGACASSKMDGERERAIASLSEAGVCPESKCVELVKRFGATRCLKVVSAVKADPETRNRPARIVAALQGEWKFEESYSAKGQWKPDPAKMLEHHKKGTTDATLQTWGWLKPGETLVDWLTANIADFEQEVAR